MNTREAIADRIRSLCKEREWTPNHLSYVAAVPQATIKSIMNGESKNPTVYTLYKIACALDVPVAELLKS